MAAKTQAAVRNAMYSAAQAVVTGMAALLLYRVLLDVLGVQLLGAWSLLASFTGLTMISQLGFSAALVKHVPESLALKRMGDVGDQIASVALAVAVLTGVALLLAYPFLGWLLNDLVQGRIDDHQVHLLHSLLPAMLLTLWLGALSGVSQRALEGFQRYDVLRTVSIAAAVLSFGLTLWAVHQFGLAGIAGVNLSLGAAGLLVYWICLAREGRKAGIQSFSPSLDWMRKLLNYGTQAQAIGILANVLDPLMKTLLTYFGGLVSVTYFTMANRVITQVRGLVQTAFKVLVPMVASAHATNAAEVPRIYRRSANALALVGMPIMAVTLAAIPAFFATWIGRWDEHFTISGLLVAVTWTANMICMPAYYVQLGTGKLTAITVVHALILAITAGVGASLGLWLGAYGVILGFCVGQLGGALLVVRNFSRHQESGEGPVLGAASLRLIGISTLVSTGVAALNVEFGDRYPSFLALMASVAVVALILLPFVWGHPLRPTLMQAVLKRNRPAKPGEQSS